MGQTILRFLFQNVIVTLSALLIDLIFGDPVSPFHPVRLIGELAKTIETFLRKIKLPGKTGGLISVTVILSITVGLYFLVHLLLSPLPIVQTAFSILTIYVTIALKDLRIHGLRVKKALDIHDIQKAREWTAHLITRETKSLDSTALIRCTVESLSENSSDAVIAPLFFGVLLGPAGALAYRVINTLDAMWGYTTERYINFGKAAAISDDLVNWIPARITGLLICLSAPVAGGSIRRAYRIMKRDHAKLKSPNAGWAEAAIAGVLGVKLAGPGIYFGKRVEKPFIGEDNLPVKSICISSSITIINRSTVLFFLLTFLLLLCFTILTIIT